LCLKAYALLGIGLLAYAQSFNNPVIYEDFPDNDIFLGPDGKTFYWSSSNFHYSPGAPILESTDLVNWQLIGHSVLTLDLGSDYSMQNGQTAYNRGTWASTLRYRKSNGEWYWIGYIEFDYLCLHGPRCHRTIKEISQFSTLFLRLWSFD
jgi:beta-xylosidase